jgi:hypothetical protein
MTSKLPVRVAEDVDATALSYAEIKALATGNPLIIEKCQLEMEVNTLKLLHASHLSQKYSMEDKILKEYPREIKRLTEKIEGYKADVNTVNLNTPNDKDAFPPIKIGGIFYDEKTEANKAIIEACKAMTSPDPIPLGEYLGFTMELSFEAYSKEYVVKIKGVLTHEVKLGSDYRNTTRIDSTLNGFVVLLQNCEEKLEGVKVQLEAAKSEVDKPFLKEQEYKEKSGRLKELDIMLNLNEKDHEIFNDEPDEGDTEISPRTQEHER